MPSRKVLARSKRGRKRRLLKIDPGVAAQIITSPNPFPDTLKMRLLLSLAGFALGLVLPVLAQEQNTVDPEVRQQIEAVLMKLVEAENKGDAAAVAALFTQDAVQVWYGLSEGGLASGRASHRKKVCSLFNSAIPPQGQNYSTVPSWQRYMRYYGI